MDVCIYADGGGEIIEDVESVHIVAEASPPYIEIHGIDDFDEMQVKIINLADLQKVHVTNE